MELAELEVLLAVAEEKGFSRAAERLGRTQPAVSQAVRRLEEEVGARLVDRTSRDGTLTSAGRVLHGYAQQMLNLRRDARGALQELQSLQEGQVVIGANEHTVVHLLPIVTACRRRHPSLAIQIRRTLASQLPADVLRREVELGVLTFRPALPGLTAIPVGHDELALLVHPAHRLAGRAEVSIRELGEESFLAHNVRSPYREQVLRAFARSRTRLRMDIELPTLEAIRRLVAQGLGVALMPRKVAEVEVARGELRAIAVREMRLERTVHLVHRRGAELSHAARAFIDCARRAEADGEA